MIAKCDNPKCRKEFEVKMILGTVPLSIPLKTYCEECYGKLSNS